ncbi:MAG TPA: fumarylacetoacetase [Bacteroidia bacterium]|jgi:fumarylacetoacetase|nr:fumarylacetoacetase [Bacteroidia bacterium]
MAKPINKDQRSWVEVAQGSDFPIQNLPFGIFKTAEHSPRAGIAIGDRILDLFAAAEAGFFDELQFDRKVLQQSTLNSFIGLGKDLTSKVRNRVAEILDVNFSGLKEQRGAIEKCLLPMKEATMLMPVHVPDYTDFYSSYDHAMNMGKMFRDPENALLPNWKHIPVGYHGRASSIVVSGTSFYRPKGQMKPADADYPVFGPTKLLDFELETAFIISKPTQLGDSIPCNRADEYIFGMVLFNDWSARDIQSWEYVPLGPFLGKNFCSVVSPWIVTLEALEPFRVAGYIQEPKVLDYLIGEPERNIDIKLEVAIKPEKGEETIVCRSNYRYMYWTMEQQLAHHTVNGCNMNVGDMLASGTISGPEEGSFGSMMEITWRGTKPLKMSDGSERKFINDNDTVIMRGYSELNGVRVGFGECASKVLPAK